MNVDVDVGVDADVVSRFMMFRVLGWVELLSQWGWCAVRLTLRTSQWGAACHLVLLA